MLHHPHLPSSVQFSDEDSDNDIDGTSPELPGPDVVNEPPHEIIMPLQYGIMQPSPVSTASPADYQSNKPTETETPLTHGSEAPRRSGRSRKTPAQNSRIPKWLRNVLSCRDSISAHHKFSLHCV